MLVTDWMRAAAIFLFIAAMIFVLSHCNRLLEPPPPKAGISIPKEETSKADLKSPLLERAEERAKKRKEYEKELARQRAEHHRLEAHLAAMLQTDIPAALGELASSAVKFRNKLADLKHLKKPERWERETPVKDGLARARDLTSEWYGLDREAQKGRHGPTLHSPSDIEALTKRIDLFKRGGEEIAEFTDSLPVLYPKVPEALMLSAVDTIARVALPKDAFDPCRDPAACPKPAPPAPSPDAPPPPTAKTSSLCVRSSAALQDLTVYAQPDTTAAVVARLKPGQCGITPTGFKDAYPGPSGWSAWQEIVIDGKSGWVREGTLTSASNATLKFTGEIPFHPGPRAAARYCVDAARTNGEPLFMHKRASPRAPILTTISPFSCRLTGTGRQVRYRDSTGSVLWIEVVHDYGHTGWLKARYLRHQR